MNRNPSVVSLRCAAGLLRKYEIRQRNGRHVSKRALAGDIDTLGWLRAFVTYGLEIQRLTAAVVAINKGFIALKPPQSGGEGNGTDR